MKQIGFEIGKKVVEFIEEMGHKINGSSVLGEEIKVVNGSERLIVGVQGHGLSGELGRYLMLSVVTNYGTQMHMLMSEMIGG